MTTPRAETAYRELITRYRDRMLLESCATVLAWDEETYLPSGGVELRGEQQALLARLEHERATDPALPELLATAEAGAFAAGSVAAVNLRELRREYERACCLPASLVEELARVTTRAQQAWEEARDGANPAAYLETLGRVVGLVQAQADCVRGASSRYQACLEDWEPELREAELDALLGALVLAQRELARAAAGPGPAVLRAEVAPAAQRAIAERIATWCGFDLAGGRIDEAAHPSTIRIGPGDVRLTTRLTPDRPLDGVFTMLHEVGHGVYDQQLPVELFGTPVGEASSLGLHEAQARMLENRIGRGRGFWQAALPQLVVLAPALGAWSVEQIVAATNAVDLGASRIRADEVTYDLHIAIRVELERALLTGDLRVEDLPEAWDAAYARDLRASTPARRGWLDDGHWAAAMFGYFPTYTIGNLAGSQLFAAAERAVPDLAAAITRLDLRPLIDWLRQHVFRFGGLRSTEEILVGATGRPLAVDDHLTNLRAKAG